ncbi:MAG: helix-turn-helix domain-containing protein [Bacteroidota bacterium]|nr:helix-turn-helix domain-containing protein [Bacteroidota bacterium]
MTYFTIEPPSILKNYVRFYWVLESDAPQYSHRSMADVCPELIFHYKGRFDESNADGSRQKSYTSGFHGQTDKVHWYHINRSFGIFGVYLYPYAMQSLFDIPAIELTDQQPSLFELLGREGSDLEEHMFGCANNQDRFATINAYLGKKLIKNAIRPEPIAAAVQKILNSKGNIQINLLSKHFCLSERQFERNFKKMAGLTPKSFSKIVRFHAAFFDCISSSKKSLTEIALENGYYDQSHFIQDAKALSGIKPKELISGNAAGLEWVKN